MDDIIFADLIIAEQKARTAWEQDKSNDALFKSWYDLSVAYADMLRTRQDFKARRYFSE